MQICLVRCPSPFLMDEWIVPPLGLMAVGTTLRTQGHEVSIYDGPLEGLPDDLPYYGFGPTTPEYPAANATRSRLVSANPTAKIILGGPHATLNPQACLADGWEAVVMGDGEFVAASAFQGSGLFVGEELPLDSYPTVDRSLVSRHRYRCQLHGRDATTVMTSQGCPFHCGFCAKNYHKVRFRSVERVCEEITALHDDLGYEAIIFPEDLFILKPDRAEAIARHLQSLNIVWRCLVRGDLIVKYGLEFSRMLAECGCVNASLGIESGSDEILRTIQKGETVATLQRAVHLMKEAGIPAVKGFFILGLPGESLETLDATRRFLAETPLDEVDIKIYQPFPGQPIYDCKEHYDIAWDDSADLSTKFYKGHQGVYHGSIRTSRATTQQIYDAWVELDGRYNKAFRQ